MKFFSFATIVLYILHAFELMHCTYKLYNIYRAYVFVSPKVIKMLYLQKMEFTLGEESEKPSKKGLTDEELSKHLDRLLEEKANNQRIYDWAEVSVRALVVI